MRSAMVALSIVAALAAMPTAAAQSIPGVILNLDSVQAPALPVPEGEPFTATVEYTLMCENPLVTTHPDGVTIDVSVMAAPAELQITTPPPIEIPPMLCLLEPSLRGSFELGLVGEAPPGVPPAYTASIMAQTRPTDLMDPSEHVLIAFQVAIDGGSATEEALDADGTPGATDIEGTGTESEDAPAPLWIGVLAIAAAWVRRRD